MLDYEVGDDLSGSTLLEEEGTYHMLVNDFNDRPLDKEGRLQESVEYDIHCEVLGGSVPHQEGKTYRLRFWRPKPDDTEKSKAFHQKQKDRFWMAVNAINGAEHKGKRVQIDEQWVVANSMQFVIKLEKTEKGFLRMHFQDVWHVDDPECAGATKNEEALKEIPPQFRRIGSRKAPSQNPPPPAETGAEPEQAPAQHAQQPTSSDGDLDYDAV